MDRRKFISRLTTASVTGAGALGFLGALRLLYPDTARSGNSFKIGRADDFPFHTFTLIKDKNIFVFRDRAYIKVVSARCTHLGCILNKTDYGFRCPCHGSNYDTQGFVLSGPAPRQLDWLNVELAHDGQLLVSPQKKVTHEFTLSI
jgi:Rieske Fe-S protein